MSKIVLSRTLRESCNWHNISIINSLLLNDDQAGIADPYVSNKYLKTKQTCLQLQHYISFPEVCEQEEIL